MIQCVDAINSSRFRSEVCVPRDPKLLVCVISFCWQPLFFWSFERLGVGYGERSERAKRNRQQVVHYHRRNCSFLSFFLRFRESCEQWPRHHVKMCNGHTHTHTHAHTHTRTHTHTREYVHRPTILLPQLYKPWVSSSKVVDPFPQTAFQPTSLSSHPPHSFNSLWVLVHLLPSEPSSRVTPFDNYHDSFRDGAQKIVYMTIFTSFNSTAQPLQQKKGAKGKILMHMHIWYPLSCYCVNVLPFLFHVWIASLFLFDNSY